jgi:hypothetical protein
MRDIIANFSQHITIVSASATSHRGGWKEVTSYKVSFQRILLLVRVVRKECCYIFKPFCRLFEATDFSKARPRSSNQVESGHSSNVGLSICKLALHYLCKRWCFAVKRELRVRALLCIIIPNIKIDRIRGYTVQY